MATKGKAGTPETVSTVEGKTAELRPAQRAVMDMLRKMEQAATVDAGDSGQAFAGDDIASILLAETEEQMWESDELPGFNAKVISGCELEIHGFEIKFSNSVSQEISTMFIGPETGRKMYLLVHSARLNRAGNEQKYKLPEVGEEFVWNTSARYIVGKLFWMWQHGYFANGGTVKCRIQGTDLGDGKSVEKLKELSAPTVGGVTEQASEPPF
jgi:hypothetical protein